MEPDTRVKTLDDLRDRLREVNAEHGEILRLGYIGNLERWGDDREWHIWIVGYDGYSRKSIWSCNSVNWGDSAYARAVINIQLFYSGFNAALNKGGQS